MTADDFDEVYDTPGPDAAFRPDFEPVPGAREDIAMDDRRCPDCGGPLVDVEVRCPDGDPECMVLHTRVACAVCRQGEETGSEEGPEPAHGDHGTCAVCGGGIRYQACPTGGWWIHDTHPADGHDAQLGGPA